MRRITQSHSARTTMCRRSATGRLLLLTLLLFAFIGWARAQVSVPYTEGFENMSSSNAPTGWTKHFGLLSGVMDGTVTLQTFTGGWSFGTGNSVFDSHAKVNIYGSSAKYWLVSPTIPMEDNVLLSFDVAYTAYSGSGAPAQNGTDDKFVVLITTDGGTTWTILRQWDNAGSEYVLNDLGVTPTTVIYDLSSYAGQDIAVAFYAESTESNADNNLHIDNVSIDYIPSCFKPTDLNATNITANSAELRWTANSGENAWKLYWKKVSDANYTEETITSNPYTLSGLEANTDYIFYVVANCGGSDGESDPSKTFTFTTTCEAFEVTEETQYTYGFETPNLLGCWTPIAGVSIQNNSNQSHESTYSMKFSGTTNNMVALPPFVNATNTLRLEFWTRPESNTNYSCGSFDVGYMTDPTNASSFVAIATYAYNDWTSAVFEKKTVDFVNAPANAYIAMRQYNNSSSWYWFVDDVTVKLMPSCLAPTGLAVVENSVTAHEASLTWTAEEGATFQWQIDGIWTDTQDNTVALTGLKAETEYTFTLRKKCSESDFSEEITVTFTTPEACPTPTGFAVAENGLTGRTATLEWEGTSDTYTVSYRTKAYIEGIEEGFGTSIPSGWENKAGLLSSVMEGTPLTTGSQWSFGTNNGVFDQHAKINIYGTSHNGWLITPEFVLPSGAALSFDLALTAYSGTLGAPQTNGTDDKFVVLISTDDEATWTILRQWDNEEGSTYVYNDINSTATGEHVSIDLSSYAGQSVRIAFYGESTESNADNNLHIDNVAIGNPVAAGEWQTVTIEETTVTLTGLTPETLYEAKVQGDCGEEGLSNETALFTFTTLESCPTPTGLAVNYTGGTEATISWTSGAEAWNLSVNGEMIENVITNSYTLTGLELATTYEVKVQAVYGEDATSEWTSVSFTTDLCMPEDMCEITFDLTDSYGDGWNNAYIAVVDVVTGEELAQMSADNHDGNNTSSTDTKTLSVCDGREIQFVWHTGSYDEECSFVIKNVNGEDIVSGSSSDLPVNYTVSCTATTCSKPTDLAVSEIGSHSAVLSWTERGEATAWLISVNEDIIETDTNPFTLTGLDPKTSYTVKVRPDCDEEKWSNEITFTTTPADGPIPTDPITITATAEPSEGGIVTISSSKGNTNEHVYDFEDGWQGWTTFQGTTTSPNSWMHNSAYSTSNNDFSTGYGYDNSDGFMLSESYISGSSSGSGTPVTPDNYLVSPMVRLGGSISFYAGARNTSYCAEKFSVMVSTTDNTNPDSFMTVETMTLSLTEAGYTSEPYTVDLSEYSGMGYVAIRHFDCYDQWFLCIDNVTIVEGEDQSTDTGNFNYGETCVVTATPQGDYHFINWTENGTTVSSEPSYSFTVTEARDLVANFAIPLPCLELADDATGNSDLISAAEEAGDVINVKLAGRTLYKDGDWNTICLPFDVTIDDSPLAEAEARTLTAAELTGTHVDLTFGDPETTLSAGVPYIIKWDGDNSEDIVDPVFENVNITSTEGQTLTFADNNVQFIGYYDAFDIAADDEDVYYLTSGSTFKHTASGRTLNAFRAYFRFSEAAKARQFVLNFGENGGTTTGIVEVDNGTNTDGSTYDLLGRKVNGRQSTVRSASGSLQDKNGKLRKGLYIRNGKKVVVK